MLAKRTNRLRRSFLVGMMVGAAFGIGAVAALLLVHATDTPPILHLPETHLHATATESSQTLSIATGTVDDSMEGLFLLDFLTGDLQCRVLNHRTGKFNSAFQANVMSDLGMDGQQKNPKYLMVTGASNFARGLAGSRMGNSVVYVVDSNTGRYVVYGVPWRREFQSAGRPQIGKLILLDAGNARTAAVRQ